MDKQVVVTKLNKDFTWEKDPIFEHFMFHKTEKVVGDCDDFALTLLYRLEGSVWKALKALLTGKASLIFCRTTNNENHYALKYEGKYADNIHPYFRDELIHKYKYKYRFPFILFWLLVGKLVKR